jgi:transcriptional regulator with GAF, ATPase, and Fis domain
MQAASDTSELMHLRQERDLYVRLLTLGTQTEIEPFLRDALALMVDVAGAHQGYLQWRDDDDGPEGSRWWIAHGFSADEIQGIRAALSQGIIAEALASGQTVVTPSALLDPRFRDRGSVLSSRIEAVLCAPIGEAPPLGVLYLQRRERPGSFLDEDRDRVELIARHLAPIAERVIYRHRQRTAEDPTRPFRATLVLDGIVGRSPALATVIRQVALVAPLDVSVLFTGESGTGKSLLARTIHDNGPRRGRPFIEVNCAALPESLVESELFGALPGAHSTAARRLEGKVAAAEHGTLLLDEVADLPPTAQGKLLQLLQSRQYYPLGASRPVQADVRVIAATNTDLQVAVREHRFREDLFYRLQVLPIRVPSLAERREDVGDLAAFFCERACDRHRLPRLTLSRGGLGALQGVTWPGNVRQLAHAVEAAAIRAAGEGALQVERAHLFPETQPAGSPETALTFQEATRRFQARLLRDTIEDTGGNIVEAARRLDLARSHVYNLIRAFGLERERK